MGLGVGCEEVEGGSGGGVRGLLSGLVAVIDALEDIRGVKVETTDNKLVVLFC